MSAAAGLGVTVQSILQPNGCLLGDVPPDSRLEGMLMIINPQGQPGVRVVLGKIGGGKGVIANEFSLGIEGIAAAENQTVNISRIGGYGWARVGLRKRSRVLVRKSGGQKQPPPGSQCQIHRSQMSVVGAR